MNDATNKSVKTRNDELKVTWALTDLPQFVYV